MLRNLPGDIQVSVTPIIEQRCSCKRTPSEDTILIALEPCGHLVCQKCHGLLVIGGNRCLECHVVCIPPLEGEPQASGSKRAASDFEEAPKPKRPCTTDFNTSDEDHSSPFARVLSEESQAQRDLVMARAQISTLEGSLSTAKQEIATARARIDSVEGSLLSEPQINVYNRSAIFRLQLGLTSHAEERVEADRRARQKKIEFDELIATAKDDLQHEKDKATALKEQVAVLEKKADHITFFIRNQGLLRDRIRVLELELAPRRKGTYFAALTPWAKK